MKFPVQMKGVRLICYKVRLHFLINKNRNYNIDQLKIDVE
jgi:hypothetical protein